MMRTLNTLPGMNSKRVRQLVCRFAAMVTIVLGVTSQLWAQGALLEKEEEPKSYVPVYLIIIFSVGLGLLVICRSGKRTVSFRRDD